MRVVDPKVAYSMLHREPPASLTPFHKQQSFGAPINSGPPQNFTSLPLPHLAGPSGYGPTSQANQKMMPPPGNFQQQPVVGGAIPGNFSVPPPATNRAPLLPNPAPEPSKPSPAITKKEEEEQQAQMLVKVLQLTDEQIEQLPQTDRLQVINLRNKLRQELKM